MPTITRFEEIDAWLTARELTRMIYAPTDQGNFAKDYGLKNQNYLGHAKASAGEMRCQLYIAMDLSYLNQEQLKQVFDLADKASRQIYRFMSYLETHPQSRRAREEGSQYEV